MQNPSTHSGKILIVEDDHNLNQQLAELVSTDGYQVERCFDGESGLLEATSQKHDLIILDIMLPKRDGVSMLNVLRKSSQVPVIILTAKGAEEERIMGLRQGADDYVSKPFNSEELLLRIQAMLRRSKQDSSAVTHQIKIDGICLYMGQNQALLNNQPIDFTQTQFKLLWELALHKGEVLSKAYLSQQVLNRRHGAYDRGLDMHMSRVRKKLTVAGWRGDRLLTVHGQGYCLK